jgi:hypothetical protein
MPHRKKYTPGRISISQRIAAFESLYKLILSNIVDESSFIIVEV